MATIKQLKKLSLHPTGLTNRIVLAEFKDLRTGRYEVKGDKLDVTDIVITSMINYLNNGADKKTILQASDGYDYILSIKKVKRKIRK